MGREHSLSLIAAALLGTSCVEEPPQYQPPPQSIDGPVESPPSESTGGMGGIGGPAGTAGQGGASAPGENPDAAFDRPAVSGPDGPATTMDGHSADSPEAKPVDWELISGGLNGAPANGPSRSAVLSGDGRFVVFTSAATNLVPGDTNNQLDVFRFDRQTKLLVRVNVDDEGGQALGSTRSAISVSADGRFVVFASAATNLVNADNNGSEDVFVRDLTQRRTSRVSTTSTGAAIAGQSANGRISANGRFVVFTSNASGILPGLDTRLIEAYVKDLSTGTVTRVTPGNLSASDVWIAGEGAAVAFLAARPGSMEGYFHIFDSATRTVSVAGGLGAEPGSGVAASFSSDGSHFAFDSWRDPSIANIPARHGVYLFTRTSGTLTRASISSGGMAANADSYGAELSGDARWIAFSSQANNLAAGASGRLEPYVLDRQSDRITRLPGGNGRTYVHSLAADGRSLAVLSTSSDLSPNDSNGVEDVFVARLPEP